jgi:hypothetical protein
MSVTEAPGSPIRARLLTSGKQVPLKLKANGIKKFIGYEVPLELCQKRYGEHAPVVLNDLRQSDDLRVLDYDGPHRMPTFSFRNWDNPSRTKSTNSGEKAASHEGALSRKARGSAPGFLLRQILGLCCRPGYGKSYAAWQAISERFGATLGPAVQPTIKLFGLEPSSLPIFISPLGLGFKLHLQVVVVEDAGQGKALSHLLRGDDDAFIR